ncbi:S41 family peptidase [Mucilaginibacter sp. PAMB04274]|uniref:S41 family peptidase n=1 Tax=Mucilaginibacter sp. PAMB04274 TaxID=3138568 RepID=UPI0031F614E3
MLRNFCWSICGLIALSFIIGYTPKRASGHSTVPFPDRVLSTQQMQADLTFMRNALEEAHPSLYRYYVKREIDSCFDDAYNQLDHAMPELEYWRVMSKLVTHISSGHTVIWPSNAAQIQYNNRLKYILPLSVAVINGKLYVSRVLTSDAAIKPGMQILAVNGRPDLNLLGTIRAFIPGDGYSNAFKDSKVQELGFLRNYWYVFGESRHYNIVYLDSAGNKAKQTLMALAINRWPVPASRGTNQPYELSYPDSLPNTAIFRIHTFADTKAAEVYDAAFADFKKQKIRNLVLDLRGNGGGLFAATTELLRYIANKKFRMAYYNECRVIEPSFMSHARNERKDNTLISRTYNPLPNGNLQVSDNLSSYLLPYTSHHYNKRIYVLTDGGTFSAASTLVAVLKTQPGVTVIGQETGGNEGSTDGGVLSIITLPSTQLQLRFPHFRYAIASAHPNSGYGVLPDVPVIANPAQIGMQVDPVMNKAGELILQTEVRNSKN